MLKFQCPALGSMSLGAIVIALLSFGGAPPAQEKASKEPLKIPSPDPKASLKGEKYPSMQKFIFEVPKGGTGYPDHEAKE